MAEKKLSKIEQLLVDKYGFKDTGYGTVQKGKGEALNLSDEQRSFLSGPKRTIEERAETIGTSDFFTMNQFQQEYVQSQAQRERENVLYKEATRGAGDRITKAPKSGSTLKSKADSAVTDLKMGLATFGQSFEKAAETLSEKGYSGKAIDSYISRTRAAGAAAANSYKSENNFPGAGATADTERKVTSSPDLSPEVESTLSTAEDIADKTFTQTPDLYVGDTTGKVSEGTAAGGVAEYEAAKPTSVGKAEDAAIEMMKKGRRATILTEPTGLLGSGEEERKTRRRRSLIGG